MGKAKTNDIRKSFADQFGTEFLREDEVLFLREDQLLAAPSEVAAFELPMQNYAVGLPYAKLLPDKRVRVSHEMAILRGGECILRRHEISQEELKKLLGGQDIDCPESLNGETLLFFEEICIGRGLAKQGRMKNNLPRTMILS